MSSSLQTAGQAQLSQAIESVLIQGDLSKLNALERVQYYRGVCQSVGLNPLTKPFDYITLNGKLTLYAKRDATDQLRKIHGVSITVTAREKHDDVYVVTARARTPDNREDESTGAVHIGMAKGEALANLFMKAETKAKRRVTLSICGLGLLDETEVESVEGSPTQSVDPAPQSKPVEVVEAPKLSSLSDLAEFVIPFGKYSGQRLKEVAVEDLKSYAKWIIKEAESKKKPIQGTVQSFLEAVTAFTAETQDDIRW